MNRSEPTAERLATAKGLSISSLILSTLFILLYGAIIYGMGDDDFTRIGAGIMFVFVVAVTFLPALFCTVVALFLVGFSRCKLAWISLLSAFLLPFVLGICEHAIESFSKK